MKPWLKYLAFATVASLYMFPFMRFTIMGSDEGILLVEAERIVNGQVYARDFFGEWARERYICWQAGSRFLAFLSLQHGFTFS